MSYHQWLSGTPKFHLTSSAIDEFAFPKSNNTRSRPKRIVSTMDDTPSRPAPPFPTLDQRGKQATPMTLQAPTMLGWHAVSDDPAVWSTNGCYPITPPTQTYDALPADVDPHQSYPQPDPTRAYVYCAKAVELVQDLPMQQTTNSWSCPLSSRDLFSGNKGGINQPPEAPYGQAMLPSPPISPPTTTKTLSTRPVKAPREKVKDQHHSSQQVRQPAYTDPMLQTSTDPHFWSTNCTVLKADSDIQSGNVISPTCMVGLPFGGMVEMTLPLAAREANGASEYT